MATPSLYPFGPLPLKSSPYNSRVSSYFTPPSTDPTKVKNYYLIGFTPGYALQASELNELQEVFYLNESLTHRMYANWQEAGYTKLPFWEGLIPYDPKLILPNQVTQRLDTIDGVEVATINVSVGAGWYLWTDSSSKLSFWIYNALNFNTTFNKTLSVKNGEYLGFEVEKKITTCCASEPCNLAISDPDLRDNSQGSTENWFTCGASRLEARMHRTENNEANPDATLLVRNAIASNFYPILKLSINNSIISLMFGDGQEVIV